MEKGPLPDEYMIYGEQLAEPVTQEVSEAEHLLEEFESHDVKEGAFIRQYKEIAANTKDSLIKFLLQLIISDEERHHAIIHSMAESLKEHLAQANREPNHGDQHREAAFAAHCSTEHGGRGGAAAGRSC